MIKKFNDYLKEDNELTREKMIDRILEYVNSFGDGEGVDEDHYDDVSDEKIKEIFDGIFNKNESNELIGKRIKLIQQLYQKKINMK